MNIPENNVDLRSFLQKYMSKIDTKLKEEVNELNGIKFQMAIKIKLQKSQPDGTEEYTDPVFRSKQETVVNKNEIENILDKVFPLMLENLEKWTQRGSF